MPKVTKPRTNLDKLAVLLRSRSNERIVIVAGESLASAFCICTSCGAQNKQPMKIRHKRGCLYMAHLKAMRLLEEMIGGRA